MIRLFIPISLCIGFIVPAPRILAADPTAQVTLGEFVSQMPALTSRPLISYCASEHSELRDGLEEAYEAFLDKLSKASRPLFDSFSSDPDFNSPVPEQMKGQVEKIGEMMLTEVKRLDSSVYCSTILTRMQETTVEQLREQIMKSYEGYRQSTQGTDAVDSGAP